MNLTALFHDQLTQSILALPRWVKRLVVLIVDVSLCVLTVWLAFFLRYGEFVALTGNPLWATVTAIAIAIPIFMMTGLYRTIFRYSGWPALLAVLRAICIYALLYMALFTAIGFRDVPRTVGIIQPILLLFMVGASRALAQIWLGHEYQGIIKKTLRPKVLIYGTGKTGRHLASALQNSSELQVAGFLDDDERLHGHVLNGCRIFNPADLVGLVKTLLIREVILAVPNASRAQRNAILAKIDHAQVAVRTLPNLHDILQGRIGISDLHELGIDDLLGREVATPNHILLTMQIRDQVVMITGAGGSIGSELCRQVMAVSPKKLLLIEHSEFALYAIHQELIEKYPEQATNIVPLLGSVQDDGRMREILSTWLPYTVYHAAAYKHVPLVEHNPAEGIKNNVWGVLTIAQLAIEYQVENLILISTDKAVRPTNIMGASKRLAELIIQGLAEESHQTKFSLVRFGNVLGSSGSVVPKFREQIRNGGPVTVTHPEVTRYFMTISEAAQLVIQASALAKGGDIFLLDMGQPVRIFDLAKRMIMLSGFSVKDEQNPDSDIEIQFTGLRPGEKLYEELLISGSPIQTNHHRILKSNEKFIPWFSLKENLKSLELAISANDVRLIRQILQKLIEGYQPTDAIVDWVHTEQESEWQPQKTIS